MPANPGLPFELRATRAMRQVLSEHKVEHDQRLPTEYGIDRQFDVVARMGAVVDRAYEARDHGRRVDIGQVEGFAKKVDKLVEKPSSAGIISSRGFSKSSRTWVQHYGTTERLRELYTLEAATPDDWSGDLRQLAINGDIKSLRPKRVTTRSSAGPAARSATIQFTADRRSAFLYSESGAVVGNLLDLLNAAMREAQATHQLEPQTLNLPPGARAWMGEQLVPVDTLEMEFEEISLPANTLIDFTGRFPDVLRDALNDRSWLIEDTERALKASRTGLDLTLAFPDKSQSSFIGIDDLIAPPPTIELEAALKDTVASLSLRIALEVIRAGHSSSAAPLALLDDLALARESFMAGDLAEAARRYRETLKVGTALEALCNLAYIAVESKKYEDAIMYSAHAIRAFPLEPHGFTNLAATLIATGRLDQARTVLEKARVLHGPGLQFRKQEAELLFLEGRIQEAAHIFYSIVLDDPEDAKSLVNLAKCEVRLGDDAHAAWDAHRAFVLAPADIQIAEFAAKIAARVSQPSVVMQIAEKALEVGALTTPLCRFAVNAMIERGSHRAALEWLQRIPVADWSQEEWALCGRLQSATGDHERAIDSMRQARRRGALTENDLLWLAESLLKGGRCEDALETLAGVADAAAHVIRALAMAELGRGDDVVGSLQQIDSAHSDALAVHCLDRMVNRGHHVALKPVAEWLLQRRSSDPRVLIRQAAALSVKSLDSRMRSDLDEASKRVTQARTAGADPSELQSSEVLLAMARGDEERAIAEASRLDVKIPSDMLALLSTRAFANEMFRLSSELADKCLSREEKPALFKRETIALERLLCAFRLGHPRSALTPVLEAAPLPANIWGRLVTAVVAYIDGKLHTCVDMLTSMLAEDPLPAQTLPILSQCLAESLRFEDLAALCAREMSSLTPVARWAAERLPTQSVTPAARAMAAAATFQHPSEFVAIAQERHIMRVTVGVDWLDSLTKARAHAPNATSVWVARLSYPVKFLRSVFSIKSPASP